MTPHDCTECAYYHTGRSYYINAQPHIRYSHEKKPHNGVTWTSTVDNNVWEPGVYGWTEVQA